MITPDPKLHQISSLIFQFTGEMEIPVKDLIFAIDAGHSKVSSDIWMSLHVHSKIA